MNEYVKQAKDFLTSCNATMEIKYVGLEKPNWDGKSHRTYDCTIKTPRGEMKVHFYDSTANTELWTMDDKEYYEKKFRRYYDGLTYQEKIRWLREFKAKKAEAIPTEYDILACLTKYEVGSMDDFMHEFGYEIKCTQDMTNFINTYNGVVKEYNDVRRCFTEEQIEALCEIN
jgi:hypothetical protein